jgi:hypothetical protein
MYFLKLTKQKNNRLSGSTFVEIVKKQRFFGGKENFAD